MDSLDSFSEDELQESREYSRWRLGCSLAEMVVELIFYISVVLWVAKPLDLWLQQSAGIESLWWRLPLFYLLIYALNVSVSFPLSWFSGHRLEHRFGLSRQTFWRWLSRQLLKVALLSVFGLLLFQGLYFLIWLTGGYWWCWAAGAMFLVSVILGQLAPVLILPLFYKVEQLDDPQLLERFKELASGTGLRIEGVYRMAMSAETAKANAMLAGLGNTRRVILGDTLLNDFSHEEIDVVLAHEVGHHVYRHIWKFIAVGFLQSLFSFWICDQLLRQAGYAIGGDNMLPVHALPLIALFTSLVGLILGPLQHAISRRFEVQCDTYALRKTKNPAAYRSAFQRLAKQNKADPQPHWLEVFFFHDHPPIAERLALADRVEV